MTSQRHRSHLDTTLDNHFALGTRRYISSTYQRYYSHLGTNRNLFVTYQIVH